MAPALIAHRGDRGRFVENTLAALAGAVGAGARFLEFDVQLSAEGTPWLFHDADLRRLSGKPTSVRECDDARLRSLKLREGGRQREEPACSLAEAVGFLAGRKRIFSFVELKTESLERFGRERCLAAVRGLLERLEDRWALISFDRELLAMAKGDGLDRIGWVLPAWDEAHRRWAESLEPAYLFCRRYRLRPGRRPWPGPWRWAVYTVDRPGSALRWWRRGFHFVETDRIASLLKDPRLAFAGESGDA